MRMLVGVIIGCALTIGGVYAADHTSGTSPLARPMVNWDIVAKNIDVITESARDGWKKIAG